MADILINVNADGFNNSLEEIETAIIRLQRNLSYMFEFLDSKNVRFLNTNQTVIKSGDKTTHIDGSQLKMYDENENLRLVMGYNPTSGEYQFELSNADGVATVTLDDDGNAVFTGKITASDIEGGTITGTRIESDSTIDVTTDLTVGENIYLTSEDDSQVGTVKKIQMFDDENDNKRARIEAERKASDEVELKIVAGKAIISTLYGLFNGADERYAVERAGVSGSFTTVDGKTVSVVNGIIQSIT